MFPPTMSFNPPFALPPPLCRKEYNGTAWVAGGNLGTARYGLAAGGNSSGAICMGIMWRKAPIIQP